MFARTVRIRRLALAAALVLAACAPAPRPAPPPAPAPVPPPAAPPPAPEPAPTAVWTRAAGLSLLREDGTAVALPHLGLRLDVLREDSAGFLVRCGACPGQPVGTVAREAVAWRAAAPVAARGGELAEFVVAVREAAARGDVEALRPVMTPRFVFHLRGPDGALEAIAAWSGPQAGNLARLPSLLDRGVAPVAGGVLAAPPEYATTPGYADLRAGFRRGPAGWEWMFLVRAGP